MIPYLLALAAAASSVPPPETTRPAALPQVTRFTLANGLKVVVQPDRRVPIVSAIVVYNVGSKDETAGQHGYAHLFEHLMIDGSAHWNQPSSRSLRDLGATGSNATTTEDRTIFYETVPRAGLARTLFLEADRMGFLAEALTPERVAREVDVVLNEKRQRGGAPYGEDWASIFADLYPSDHPYHHSVIGTEADLHAVTVDQARTWFKTFYGPANATLILTGDIDAAAARALVTTYFGALTPRLPIDRVLTRAAALPGAVRRQVFAAVPAARVYATYCAPPAGSPEIADLDLIAQIMGNGATARLSRRLVNELGIAKTVMVTFNEKLLSSEMGFVVDGVAPEQVARVESELDAELARLIAHGPTPDELERARTARIRYIQRSQESTFGKAFLLMRGASLTDDPDYSATYVRQLTAATPARLQQTAARIYGAPAHHLIIRPIPVLTPIRGAVDLAKGPPPLEPITPIAFPAVEQTTLSNGLKVILLSRHAAVTAHFLLRIEAGSASAEQPVPAFAMALLAKGPGTSGSDTVARQIEALGGQLAADVRPDYADLSLATDAAKVAEGAAIFGDVIVHPQFSADTLDALRRQRIANLRGEQTRASALAQRLVRNRVYGAMHPYGQRQSALDDISAVAAVTPAAVEAWNRRHVRPDRATLYVAADSSMAQLRPLLETALRGWVGTGPAEHAATIAPAATAPTPDLTVVDVPGATQTVVVAGRTLPASTTTGDIAIEAANNVYGGNDTARIGTNLRQIKGWTYGIGSGAQAAHGQRLWQIAGSVAREHSGAAVAELIAELRALGSTHPPEQAELDRIVATSVNKVATQLEDAPALLKAMADARSYGRPYDTIVRDPAAYRALTLGAVRQAAQSLGDPARLHWVIVGDWQRIHDQFAGLKLGTPLILPASGS